uniref:Uncharacterized protein n=1 Tax=Manihot esculenta TaxID=3983 RepID=A0A2C9WGN2_MANES
MGCVHIKKSGVSEFIRVCYYIMTKMIFLLMIPFSEFS